MDLKIPVVDVISNPNIGMYGAPISSFVCQSVTFLIIFITLKKSIKFKVDISGINTNSLKVLTNEENINLFKEKMNGNKDASEQIINGNLKLVLSLVSKYRHKDIDMNDLFQAGCIGLIKAVNNFDLSCHVFGTNNEE